MNTKSGEPLQYGSSCGWSVSLRSLCMRRESWSPLGICTCPNHIIQSPSFRFNPFRKPLSMMATPALPPNHNRAGEVYAFTWILEILSLTFVVGRMYSRIKLTRNVWWDDWCVCIALVSESETETQRCLAGLIGEAFRPRHLDHVECLRWSRLCKTYRILERCPIVGCS